jgi:hypothetical protein
VTTRYEFEEENQVRRRVDPRTFERAGELVDQRQKAATSWYVCTRYELLGGTIRATPDGWGDEPQTFKPYKPLTDVPDLFLRFARLHKEKNFAEAALAWSHKYGVPGGDSQGRFPSIESMDLSLFRTEAKRAWVILTLYEATLNRDAQVVRDLIHDDLYRDDVLEWSLKQLHEEWHEADYLATALLTAVHGVDDVVHQNCIRELYVPGVYFDADPSRVRSRWDFVSLLGAMYLQMYWLMESGDVTRCEHCRRVISLARPHPDGRKRRRDKRFCDDACRQAHHRSKKKP